MKSRNLLLTVLGSLIVTMGAAIPAAAANFTVSVAVTGLTSGTLVMQDNKTDTLTFTGNTTQTFTQSYANGASYTVRVKTQPTGQTCTLSSNSTGTITANTTVTASCSSTSTTDTISVAVSGLTSGTLVMQDNKNETLNFTANGTQSFPTAYNSGSSYTVRVKTQPAGQTCTLSSNATGTITSNTTVTATCAPKTSNDTLSVSVSGLTSGTLLVQDDKADQLTFAANGSQTFTTSYASGSTYSVSVVTQPAGQTCTLGANASGTITANTTVTATCKATSSNFTISVAVTGLTSGTLVMQDNKTETLTFTTNNTQTFPTAYTSGSSYTVRVKTQPAGFTCTLSSNATGTITANTTVTATCAPKTSNFTLSVAASGVVGTLVVKDDKADTLTFTANGTQAFASSYVSGSTYSVTIQTQPAGQTCTLGGNASGTITANTTVTATCVSNFTISVAATGLTGTLVVKDDKADQLTFTTNNTQAFASTYASGSTYSVTIQTQPAGQTCTLSGNASGTITANITVTATCSSTANLTISVAASGLVGTLIVQDNKGDGLTFTTNNTQTFSSQYASGSSYSVTIQTQPAGQTCTLGANASGTITANTTVTATCVSNFTLSVTATGLTGTLIVQDSKLDQLTFTTNNTQSFATSYAGGSTYSVTIQNQPAGQTCTLSPNASGTITANTTVTATCANSGSGLTVSVAVTGLSGGSVILTDDQGDTLTFNNNSTQSFAKTYTTGSTYTVYVSTQPTSQSCIPTYSTGTMNSNVTINASCATGATRALGTVSGVSSVTCQGGLKNGVCQQMTVSCSGVPDVFAYVKTNTPTGTVLGTVTYNTGTDGNGLYESIFTFGNIAVGNVFNAGYRTVQISWGTPFNTTQPAGWVQGPGGVLAGACRYATVTKWIFDNIQASTAIPMCATANSGGAGVLAYALSQYPSSNVLAMAEVTSGPPTARLDWGCGCLQGSKTVQCGSASTLGTCFGKADAPVWDPAYNPNATTGLCSAAVGKVLPPGGLNFFLGDSVEAPGALYSMPKTFVNLVFGGADNSSAIPIGEDWYNNITTNKNQACVPGGMHSLANTSDGATQIANDLIGMCRLQ
jgi:hypothetical protein